MAWKETRVVEERFRFIEDWKKQEWSLAELCRRYQVSRKTGYKWTARYEEGGLEGLNDRSRAPHHNPRAVLTEVEDEIVAARGTHPTWGPEKLRAWLERTAPEIEWPAPSTIGAILQRQGLIVPRRKRRRASPNAEPLSHAVGPNVVWCTDFKGWFRCGDGVRCYPLTLTDAYSRYLLRCQALSSTHAWRAHPIYESAFREYGLPDIMRNDNGEPFASTGLGGLTWLSVWWIKLGIRPERIRPGKPSENGRHERMHLTLQQDVTCAPAANLRRQQVDFNAFRRIYNEQRPHAALAQKTPQECYCSSPRPYPERMTEIVYPADYQLRRIDQTGQFRWRHVNIYLTRALSGEVVGLQPIADRRWRVYFSFYLVGEFVEGRTRVGPAQESTTARNGAPAPAIP